MRPTAPLASRFLIVAAALLLTAIPLRSLQAETSATTNTARPLAAAPPVQTNAICEITGRVDKIETVAKAPWQDGTPTVISETETRISILLEKRFAHPRTPKAPCAARANGKSLSYKLCSPTPIKKGDRIRATEGTAPLARADAICLFDITLIPAQ